MHTFISHVKFTWNADLYNSHFDRTAILDNKPVYFLFRHFHLTIFQTNTTGASLGLNQPATKGPLPTATVFKDRTIE